MMAAKTWHCAYLHKMAANNMTWCISAHGGYEELRIVHSCASERHVEPACTVSNIVVQQVAQFGSFSSQV